MPIDSNCLICERISAIMAGNNPFFVAELETGYVVIGDYQFFRGYTLFLCKEHKRELHELDVEFRKKFLWEMSVVAEAVFKAFNPVKLNYELLGNSDSHMHWHVFPRHKDDPMPNRTVWNVDRSLRYADSAKPSPSELEMLRDELRKHL